MLYTILFEYFRVRMRALINIPLGLTLLVMIMMEPNQVNARPKFFLVETDETVGNLDMADKVRILTFSVVCRTASI